MKTKTVVEVKIDRIETKQLYYEVQGKSGELVNPLDEKSVRAAAEKFQCSEQLIASIASAFQSTIVDIAAATKGDMLDMWQRMDEIEANNKIMEDYIKSTVPDGEKIFRR
ncbi:hypothetical protein KAR91_36610 [Candidatus Pacearchaeota archaeon]|nr:hypothetical protein [Candidatus Pacearchaeota archaeon]